MVITIPHLGNVYIAVKALFDELNIPYVIPEQNNNNTLQTGSYYSPEEICLPFKIMMGNIINSIEMGADTVIITGSCGPCRFGEYCELQMKILNKLGHKIKFIVIDSPSEIGKDEFWNRIGQISKVSKLNRIKKIAALRNAFKILNLIDKIDAKAHYLAGYEINKGEYKSLLRKCKLEAFKCKDSTSTIAVLSKYYKLLSKIQIDKTKNPIKIALIGEIYSMIEPYSNLFIEEKLMDYGVSTTRLLSPSWWVKDLILKPLNLNSLDIKAAAKKYLPFNVGGHGKESVAHAVISKRDNFNGVIQIFPLGCMPEIVTKAILPTIQKEKDLPIMTLIIDEMTGEVGYITRIEAFLDMLKTKTERSSI